MNGLKLRLKIVFGVLIVVIALGTLGFKFIEGLSLVDAFYFSIVTITTVGYGDIHPSTEPGKILAMVLIISGVGTFLAVVANATEILMSRREREIRRQKTNMVLRTFFSDIGIRLLKFFTTFDPHIENIGKDLKVTKDWSKREFSTAKTHLEIYDFSVDVHRSSLESLSLFLEEKGDNLLRSLENPVLLEHESFAGVLQAIIHLRDEFLLREDLNNLPESDNKHIAGDIRRAYRRLAYQWLDYMNYLRADYPYLFNLASRTNPFDPNASPIVT